MNDKERNLFRCIGGIDDELVLEASTARFPSRRWGHLIALAACLALVLSIPLFLSRDKGGPASQLPILTDSENKTASSEAAGSEHELSEPGSLDHETLGGIAPGMTEDQVLAVYDEPLSREYGCLNYDGFYFTLSQFLPQVTVLDTVSGDLTLSTGIGPGSTEEALLAAYPALERTEYENTITYSMEENSRRLTVGVQNGLVTRVILEDFRDLLSEALTANEITMYLSASEGWLTVTAAEKAAKRICTVLTISEPEEAEMPEGMLLEWLDFGNGTVVGLVDSDWAIVYTCTGNFDPDSNDNLTPQLCGRFPGLDDAVCAALADPNETWDKNAPDPVDGTFESAPEAEP